MFVAEYATESELFDSLKNRQQDKIWLFDCKSKADFDFLIVGAHEDSPVIGIEIQMPTSRRRDDGDGKFDACLINWAYDILRENVGRRPYADSGGIDFSNSGNDNADVPEDKRFKPLARGMLPNFDYNSEIPVQCLKTV